MPLSSHVDGSSLGGSVPSPQSLPPSLLQPPFLQWSRRAGPGGSKMCAWEPGCGRLERKGWGAPPSLPPSLRFPCILIDLLQGHRSFRKVHILSLPSKWASWSVARKPFLASGWFSPQGPQVPFLPMGHSRNQEPCATPYAHRPSEGGSPTACAPAWCSGPPVSRGPCVAPWLSWPELAAQGHFQSRSLAQCRTWGLLPPSRIKTSPAFFRSGRSPYR